MSPGGGKGLSARKVSWPSANAGSGDSSDLALSLSTRWAISPSVSLEMEYQYSRIAAEADRFSGELRHEGVVVQLKLAF